jgi:hypothetical protein
VRVGVMACERADEASWMLLVRDRRERVAAGGSMGWIRCGIVV